MQEDKKENKEAPKPEAMTEQDKQPVNTEAGTPEPVKTPEDIIKEKDAKIAEMTDKYLRALAEYDNFRKRVAKDKEDFVKYSKADAVSVFLPVVDNFERALSAADKVKDFDKLKHGIEMVLKQFEGALKDMGAKEIHTKGVFDPHIHHAMHKEQAPGKKEGEILEVYQKGYMMEDKIIRPAMVKIAHNDEHKHNGKEEHK